MISTPYLDFYREHVTPDEVVDRIDSIYQVGSTRGKEYSPTEESYIKLMEQLNQLESDVFGCRFWGYINSQPVYVEANHWMFGSSYKIHWLKGKPE